MKNKFNLIGGALSLALSANIMAGCEDLPDHATLTANLKASVMPSGGPSNGGFDLNMWLTTVDTDGVVCNVTFTGASRIDQWPGSRVISAQKANTARAFSLPGLALSTANLFNPTQPGNSLFGLQFSNPVDTAVAYGRPGHNDRAEYAESYGQADDPMVGKMIGGVNVFGGGLALYDENGIIGALGVSGDSSCADHNIAWRTREALGLGTTAAAYPGGVNPAGHDGIIYDQTNGFSHTFCGGTEDAVAAAIGSSDGTLAPAAP
jgi:Haem degrading protein HbpS-like